MTGEDKIMREKALRLKKSQYYRNLFNLIEEFDREDTKGAINKEKKAELLKFFRDEDPIWR